MKKLLSLIGTLAVLAVPALAQDDGVTAFATTGTAINSGTNYAIIPPVSALMPSTQLGGVPTVNYLNVSGFSANAITLTSYITTNIQSIVATNNTATNYVTSTNGFSVGQFVVIQHSAAHPLKRFSCEAGIVHDVLNTNMVVLNAAPANNVLVGDLIQGETSWASLPLVSSSTTPTSIVGTGIVTGQRNKPFLLVVTSAGVGTNTINAVNSLFNP